MPTQNKLLAVLEPIPMRISVKLVGLGVSLFLVSGIAIGQTAVTTTAGTTNQIPKMSGSSTIVDSAITESNGNVGIGTTTPDNKLQVPGLIEFDANRNVALGQNALGANAGSGNVAVGYTALQNNTSGTDNIAIGAQALLDNTTGWSNEAIGSSALVNNTTGTGNTAIGIAALTANTTGYSNIAIGPFTMYGNTAGWANIAIGQQSLQGLTGGYENIGLGIGAGASISDGVSPNQNSSESIYIGNSTKAKADYDTNEIVIGANAVGAGSNTVTLGNTAVTSTVLQGTVNMNNVVLNAGSGASITFHDGTTQSTAWNGVLSGGDYAESVDVVGDRKQYEPGDVMIIDPNQPDRFLKSSQPYSTMVSGIYSTKPGLIGRHQQVASAEWKENQVPMATMGIVPTKVSAENGPIKPGDLLVSSSTPGYAMRGTDRERRDGAVIGKAMGLLESGKGMIEVLVSLQ